MFRERKAISGSRAQSATRSRGRKLTLVVCVGVSVLSFAVNDVASQDWVAPDWRELPILGRNVTDQDIERCETGRDEAVCVQIARDALTRPIPDCSQAVGWLGVACESGHEDACVHAGWLALTGYGNLEPTPELAAAALTEACNNHAHGVSCYLMAQAFEHGSGVRQVAAVAAGLYSFACELGVVDACRQSGQGGRSPQPSTPPVQSNTVQPQLSSARAADEARRAQLAIAEENRRAEEAERVRAAEERSQCVGSCQREGDSCERSAARQYTACSPGVVGTTVTSITGAFTSAMGGDQAGAMRGLEQGQASLAREQECVREQQSQERSCRAIENDCRAACP
jgi:hypothetical protein